jgi:hypothetical protein
VQEWIEVKGALTYDDAKGRHWQTSFSVEEGAGRVVIIFHDPPGLIDEIGHPKLPPPEWMPEA